MLERLVNDWTLGLALSAAVAASPLYAQEPPAELQPGVGSKCTEKVSAGVEIGSTTYCTDKYGIIYDGQGQKVTDSKILLEIGKHADYQPAKERSEALWRQQEAIKKAANSPEVTEGTASPPEKRGPPPPYLFPSGQRYTPSSPPSSPPSFSPSYTPSTAPTAEQEEVDRGLTQLRMAFGVVLTGLGITLLYYGTQLREAESGLQEECDKGGPCVISNTGWYTLGTGAGAAILGIYLLAK